MEKQWPYNTAGEYEAATQQLLERQREMVQLLARGQEVDLRVLRDIGKTVKRFNKLRDWAVEYERQQAEKANVA